MGQVMYILENIHFYEQCCSGKFHGWAKKMNYWFRVNWLQAWCGIFFITQSFFSCNRKIRCGIVFVRNDYSNNSWDDLCTFTSILNNFCTYLAFYQYGTHFRVVITCSQMNERMNEDEFCALPNKPFSIKLQGHKKQIIWVFLH